MKKIVLLLVCFISYTTVIAQHEKQGGDEMAASENYSGAAMMYRLCMEQDDECTLKLFKLLYDAKIEAQSTNEGYRLISPLAEKGNAEAQYYLGSLYLKDMGISQRNRKSINLFKRNAKSSRQNDREANKWFQKSANQGHAAAQYELGRIYQWSGREKKHRRS